MKKRGFTLIELLAVIVVLAIIALIATPIVMNTIKNSKIGAAERTADNYVKQVETTITLKRMEGTKIKDGTYKINTEGNICLNKECNELLTVEMSGTKPSSGYITIENKEINKMESKMKINEYNIIYDKEKQNYVVLEVLCTAVTELSIQNYYDKSGTILLGTTGILASENGYYSYGVEYSCELGDGEEKTFYVLEEKEDTVSLIMNMNIDSNGKETTIGNTVAWSADGSNANGPVTALEYLKNSTASWTKLEETQIGLPSGDQIANASLNENWDGIKGGNYNLPTWLYENLKIVGVPYGYWTLTPYPLTSYYVWHIYYNGFLSGSVGSGNVSLGVRPVITISKTQLG